MKSLKVTPYALKMVAKRVTQTKELEASLAECNNVVLKGEQQPKAESLTDKEEVDLDSQAEFEEGALLLMSPWQQFGSGPILIRSLI